VVSLIVFSSEIPLGNNTRYLHEKEKQKKKIKTRREG